MRMKIISLNTWAGALLNPLLSFFKTYQDVDIFCLQEIYSDAKGKALPRTDITFEFELFERIREILKETHTGYFRPCYSDYYGQAIFIRNTIEVEEEGDVIIYENHKPEKRGQHTRNLQYMKIKADKESLFIANIHGLWNGQGKTDTEDRIRQSKKIRDFVDNRNEKNKILVGDFNLSPDTQSLTMIKNDMKDLIQEYRVTSTRTSYYNKENKYADYIFVSPNIDVTDFKVLPDEVSDHAAVYVEIK